MENVVVLVPGFLGFARFGGFYYFADRLISTLRGSLQLPEGGALPVVPVTTLPTDSLRNRQTALLEQLAEVSRRVEGVEWIHLIGHSTGGVDAQLLACTRSIDDKAWDEKWAKVRSKIKSVITISAPHHGTELADSQFALLAKSPLDNPRAIIAGAGALRDLLHLGPRYLAANAGFDVTVPNNVLKFIWQVIQNRGLIDDLKPERMEELRTRLHQDPDITLKCFVTGTAPRHDQDRPSDPLFSALYGLTQGSAHVSSTVQKCNSFLQKQVEENPDDLVIRSQMSNMPDISPMLNDGVVNTARQIVRPKSEELGGFVVADHADVLGHYDRQDGLIGGKPYNAGLFHSGAGFADNQFFELYWCIAQVILGVRAQARQSQGHPLHKSPPPALRARLLRLAPVGGSPTPRAKKRRARPPRRKP